MPTMMDKPSIISELENQIADGKKVILYQLCEPDMLFLLQESCLQKDIVDIEIWHCLEEISLGSCCKKKSADQMEELTSFYFLYEFSDRVRIISDNLQFGNLLHYVSNNIMTLEDMTEAILVSLGK